MPFRLPVGPAPLFVCIRVHMSLCWPIPSFCRPMNNESLARLEERLAWLQRHVTEQDRAMLEMAGEIDRLKQQVAELRAKSTGDADGPEPADGRPPHY